MDELPTMAWDQPRHLVITQHGDLDDFLGQEARKSPFIQARRKIAEVLKGADPTKSIFELRRPRRRERVRLPGVPISQRVLRARAQSGPPMECPPAAAPRHRPR